VPNLMGKYIIKVNHIIENIFRTQGDNIIYNRIDLLIRELERKRDTVKMIEVQEAKKQFVPVTLKLNSKDDVDIMWLAVGLYIKQYIVNGCYKHNIFDVQKKLRDILDSYGPRSSW